MNKISIDDSELWVTRLLVFLETAPQSDEYRQVQLTPKQFKAVSDAICDVVFVSNEKETVSIELSQDTYKLPDLPEMYGEKEV